MLTSGCLGECAEPARAELPLVVPGEPFNDGGTALASEHRLSAAAAGFGARGAKAEWVNGGAVHLCPSFPTGERATTATLLLDAGVAITKVQKLLGRRHITTTQIYDTRRRSTQESASHDGPI